MKDVVGRRSMAWGMLSATVLVMSAGCGGLPTRSELPAEVRIPASLWHPVERRDTLRTLTVQERARHCPDYLETLLPPFLPEVKLIGSLTNYNSVAQAFISALASYLPYTVAFGEPGHTERLYAYLVKAAESKAFLQRVGNDFGINGYSYDNEPAYVQSLMLIPLSLSYDYLSQTYGANDPGIVKIRHWGDALFNAVIRAGDRLQKGYDRWAGKAAGFSLWGAVSGNREAVSAGWNLFDFGQSVVRKDGRHIYASYYASDARKAIKYLNMAVGMQVLAAEGLASAGFGDIYDWKEDERRGSLHDAVHRLVEFSNTVPGSHLNNHYHPTLKGPAWIEFYLRRFPGTPTSALIERSIERPDKYGFYTGYFGGWTTCLVYPLPGNGQ